jgi:hypothetical protein
MPQDIVKASVFSGRECLHGNYKSYWEKKQKVFYDTITTCTAFWESFELLDEIWSVALSDLEVVNQRELRLPLSLFLDAHSKIRIAFELGFSLCLPEGCGVLRGGVESVAHACKLLREPILESVWLNKRQEPDAYRRAFEENKRDGLFPKEHGLNHLHYFWKTFSEFGSHTTLSGLGSRLAGKVEDSHLRLEFAYLDARKPLVNIFLPAMLVCAGEMINVLLSSFDKRLQFDLNLGNMNRRLTEQLRGINQTLRIEYRDLTE